MSSEVIEWLRSEEGEDWSRERYGKRPANHHSLGIFGEIKGQTAVLCDCPPDGLTYGCAHAGATTYSVQSPDCDYREFGLTARPDATSAWKEKWA